MLEESTLRERLARRTSNNFGKAPVELEAILGWNRTIEATYREFGAIIVNADQSLAKVVEQILANAGIASPDT